MNRRQLFKGAIGVIGAAMLPAVALAGSPQAARVIVDHTGSGLPNHLTPSQYLRVKSLYGNYAEFASVGYDYAVGYSHHLFTVTETGRAFYKVVEDRPDHMFAGHQMFHGKSWEEAIVYAETYKCWLRVTTACNSVWRDNHIHKVLANDIYWYNEKAEMLAGVDKLSWTRYNT